MKTCIKCERTMPISCFTRSKRSMTGYTSTCKDCAAEIAREQRAKVIPIGEYLKKWKRVELQE